MKLIFNSILSIFNLQIIKLNSLGPYDFTKKKVNPLSAQYLVEQSKIIIDIDLSIGRTNNWFDMSDKSLDPAIFAIRNALKKNLKNNEFYEEVLFILKKNSSLKNLKNVANVLGIDSIQNKNFRDYPWWSAVNPWDSLTFEDKIKNFPFEIKKNRASNGMYILSNDPNEIIKEDYEKSLPSHARQYLILFNNIKKHGFRFGSKYGYVSAEIFVANNQLRWKTGKEGNHRVAVAAALGIKKIPVLLSKIIRVDEVDYWPNVVKGHFSKEEAIKIFYNIFDAKPSKVYDEWTRINS